MAAPQHRVATDPANASVLVALPGTGSDGDYARRAFAPVADALRLPLVAVDPAPDGIVDSYRRALQRAAVDHGAVLVAGISIGACVGVDWASRDPRCVGVLAAMPPWIVRAENASPAPAALSAAATAEMLERLGTDGAIAEMRRATPAWLGAELQRSWTAIGAPLRGHLLEAASMRLPTEETIAALTAPMAVVGVRDDPIHPYAVATRWAEMAPSAGLAAIDLAEWGHDAGSIGRAALRALPTPD